MVWYFLIGALSALGAFGVLWAAFGWLLPVCRGRWLVYPAEPGDMGFVPVYLWLRSVGLVNCPLILADLGLSPKQRAYLTKKGIEIYSLSELPERLGIGAETFDGRIGDHPGRDQRGDLSEL